LFERHVTKTFKIRGIYKEAINLLFCLLERMGRNSSINKESLGMARILIFQQPMKDDQPLLNHDSIGQLNQKYHN